MGSFVFVFVRVKDCSRKMGVKTLWAVIDCAGESSSIDDLRGKTVAIDLAGWVVSNNQCRAMAGGKVAKPHLRNVFFRTAALVAAGVKPIFILDGAAPELKRATMEARKATQNGGTNSTEVKSMARTRLKALMNECRFLLSAMGLKCQQADGEGEALCARMNADGLVHAVISDDSDAFCYGARVVMRNFGANAKDMEKFDMSKIERTLGLSRDRMVVMAILLGCDFIPAGIGGIGKETVMQLFSKWKQSWNGLECLNFWIETSFEAWTECSSCEDLSLVHCNYCERWQTSLAVSDCICNRLRGDRDFLKVDTSIKKKCRANIDPTFWGTEYRQIVDEFLAAMPGQDHLPSFADITQIVSRDCPKIAQCMSILVKKCFWLETYALEKVIPLLTRWQLEHLSSGGVMEVLGPIKIVKRRTVAGVASLVIEWKVSSADAEETCALPASFESIEEAELVRNVYQHLYDDFVADENNKKKKKRVADAAVTSRRRKKEAGTAAGTGTQPITEFFTQRKTQLLSEGGKAELLAARATQKNVVMESRGEPVTMNESDILADDSDLSLIIDGILSKKVQELSFLKEQQPELHEAKSRPLKSQGVLAVATSTPISDKVATRLPLSRVLHENRQSVKNDPAYTCHKFEKKAMGEDQYVPDTTEEDEDSFDRMCR